MYQYRHLKAHFSKLSWIIGKGAREKQSSGNSEFDISRFEAGRPAYDLSSDIVDNPGNGSLLMLMVQSNLYNSRDAEILMNSYVDLLV